MSRTASGAMYRAANARGRDEVTLDRRLTISDVTRSIERQYGSVLVVGHACEIVSRIDVSRPAEKEFLERLRRLGAEWVDDAAKGDLDGKALGSRDRL